MPASDFVWAARTSQGWSQRELAARLGVSQPVIAALESGAKDATVSRLESILRAANQRLIAAPVPSWALTAADTAAIVRADLERQRPQDAFRALVQFADDLRAVDPATRVVLAIGKPATTGAREWDAFIAGTTEWALDLDGLPHPAWLDEPAYSLSEPWDVEELPALREPARAATPPALARHGVFIDASFYASV